MIDAQEATLTTIGLDHRMRRTDDRASLDTLLGRLDSSSGVAERRSARHRVITECLPIADHIGHRFAERGQPTDDLVQVARMGLIKAVDRYQPDKGHFLAFAIPTILGEVRRYFRDSTWSMRVPRRMQENYLRSRSATEALSQRLRRTPTTSDLADELQLDCAEIRLSQSVGWAYRPMSLDAPVHDAYGATDQTVGSLHGDDDLRYNKVEDMIVLREAIAELDPRRQALLRMRYFESLTQSEIAKRLNISQVQVSRLLNATLRRIRDRMCVDIPVFVFALAQVGVVT